MGRQTDERMAGRMVAMAKKQHHNWWTDSCHGNIQHHTTTDGLMVAMATYTTTGELTVTMTTTQNNANYVNQILLNDAATRLYRSTSQAVTISYRGT
jgi:hypothetical protein